jgi:hypothetical protein
MSGSATLATARFKLATAARISATRTRPDRAGAVDLAVATASALSPAVASVMGFDLVSPAGAARRLPSQPADRLRTYWRGAPLGEEESHRDDLPLVGTGP